jgi:hypothetical protein
MALFVVDEMSVMNGFIFVAIHGWGLPWRDTLPLTVNC